jgi:hypothetical protein
VRVFVDQGRELHRGRKAIGDPNAPAARRAESTAEIVDGFERNAMAKDRRLERSRLGVASSIKCFANLTNESIG